MTLSPAPPTPLNRTPGPHRDFAFVREPIAEAKAIKDALGGTLNDVVLAVVSGALRRFLDDLGCPVDSMRLRACVPMSVRTSDQAAASGNRIVIMVAELPIDIADPVARLHQVSQHMTGLKPSRQAVAAETMIQMEQWMPPNVLAQATRLGFSSRLYNLLVTNVLVPQFPVYMLGRRMLEVYPIAFLAPEHTLAVALLSYDGSRAWGCSPTPTPTTTCRSSSGTSTTPSPNCSTRPASPGTPRTSRLRPPRGGSVRRRFREGRRAPGRPARGRRAVAPAGAPSRHP